METRGSPSSWLILRDNGYIFKIEKEEVIEFLLQLAKGEPGLKEVKEWIKRR